MSSQVCPSWHWVVLLAPVISQYADISRYTRPVVVQSRRREAGKGSKTPSIERVPGNDTCWQTFELLPVSFIVLMDQSIPFYCQCVQIFDIIRWFSSRCFFFFFFFTLECNFLIFFRQVVDVFFRIFICGSENGNREMEW